MSYKIIVCKDEKERELISQQNNEEIGMLPREYEEYQKVCKELETEVEPKIFLETYKEQKEIDDIKKYVQDLIEAGDANLFEAAKFSRISARQGTVGETVQTILADGTVETTPRQVEIDEKTGNPGWVVNNVNGPEQWIITDSVFQKKYEIDPENPDVYRPKGAPMLAVEISENITFAPPNWGGAIQNINSGGFLLIDQTNPNDIYGIAKDEFHSTYAETERDREEVHKAAVELLEIEENLDR